jgi:hypothetical protein
VIIIIIKMQSRTEVTSLFDNATTVPSPCSVGSTHVLSSVHNSEVISDFSIVHNGAVSVLAACGHIRP